MNPPDGHKQDRSDGIPNSGTGRPVPATEGPADPLLVIVGATASGKNRLAQEIADRLGKTLLSVDSRKVYRGLDIGTAKPSRELQERFSYAMIDCVNPDETYSAGRFAEEARAIIAARRARGQDVILVGGTGFYLEAFRNGIADLPPVDSEIRAGVLKEADESGWEALHHELQQTDPAYAANIHPSDKTRILRGTEILRQTGEPISRLLARLPQEPSPWPLVVFALNRPREDLYRLIDARTEEMLDAGLIDEVQSLRSRGYSAADPGMRTVGYIEIMDYLEGRISRDEAVERFQRNTRRYAKRQLTWFRNRPYVRTINSETTVIQRVISMWQRAGGH